MKLANGYRSSWVPAPTADGLAREVSIELPMRLQNPLNGAQWGKSGFAKSRARKQQRTTVGLTMQALLLAEGLRPPCVVTVTRVAPRKLDEHDGLPASCKAVIDGIADALGVNDRDPSVTWVIGQERGAPKYYGVRITVRRQA